MSEKEKFPLVPASSTSVVRLKDGPGTVLSRMSTEVLEAARGKRTALEWARFRVGGYEFRRPDYHQIMRWAGDLQLSPLEVVEFLDSACSRSDWGEVRFAVVDGAITSIVWDCDRFPIDVFSCDSALCVHTVSFYVSPPYDSGSSVSYDRRIKPGETSIDVLGRSISGAPSVKRLECSGNWITNLELSNMRYLESLMCNHNFLAELDLSKVPDIKRIGCGFNRLTSLDVSGNALIRSIGCRGNYIIELTLSGAKSLEQVDCSRNRLSELVIPDAPHLHRIDCSDNKLAVISFSQPSDIKSLTCKINQLTKLDLCMMPRLQFLDCANNRIKTLDLSCVPDLEELHCENNDISEIDVSSADSLQVLVVDPGVKVIGVPPKGFMVAGR